MATVICGSLAFDTIMTFEGRFADQILADQLHILNVSFLVPTLRRDFGGCAGWRMRLEGPIQGSIQILIAGFGLLRWRADDDHDLAPRGFGGVAIGELGKRAGDRLFVQLADFADDGCVAVAEPLAKGNE